MADHDPSPWLMIAPSEAVAQSAGREYWSVREFRRQHPEPQLPREVSLLLAPPIVLSAVPLGAPVAAAAPRRAPAPRRAADSRRTADSRRAAEPSRPAVRRKVASLVTKSAPSRRAVTASR